MPLRDYRPVGRNFYRFTVDIEWRGDPLPDETLRAMEQSLSLLLVEQRGACSATSSHERVRSTESALRHQWAT